VRHNGVGIGSGAIAARRIAGSPDRRIAGSPDRRIASSTRYQLRRTAAKFGRTSLVNSAAAMRSMGNVVSIFATKTQQEEPVT